MFLSRHFGPSRCRAVRPGHQRNAFALIVASALARLGQVIRSSHLAESMQNGCDFIVQPAEDTSLTFVVGGVEEDVRFC